MALAGVLVLLGVAGGWALRTVLAPATDVLEAPEYTLVAAQEGSVGQSLRLNTAVEWTPESAAVNQATGIVTGLDVIDGDVAEPGDELYTVDLRPVVLASGEVPAFRDLRPGDQGEDVAQLQELLAAEGFLAGDADGRFDAGVERAVRAWQSGLGIDEDGVVRQGDLIFVSELPARLTFDQDIEVGVTLAGGEPAVHVLPAAPSFTISLPEGQARLVATGMVVKIHRNGDDAWSAEIIELRQAGEPGGQVAVLGRGDGGPICVEECVEIPMVDVTLLSSEVHVVPEAEGVTVPAAALVTTAAGDTAVVLASGELRPVEVVTAASGQAVVEGVEPGEQVRTPGADPAAGEDTVQE